ncbi:hypothetical protein F4810DRAFT_650853 [Camillea tinctor]|nr:hypothetical protein F4810DRAFT_650853 [Camillea tinctor]
MSSEYETEKQDLIDLAFDRFKNLIQTTYSKAMNLQEIKDETPDMRLFRAFHLSESYAGETGLQLRKVILNEKYRGHVPIIIKQCTIPYIIEASLECIDGYFQDHLLTKKLDAAAAITITILRCLKSSLNLYDQHDPCNHLSTAVSNFMESRYGSTKPEYIFAFLLGQSNGSNVLKHENLIRYSVVQRYLAEIHTLDPHTQIFIWSAHCAMTCSLDDSTRWAGSHISSASYIFRQAAEWILKAGPEIAAASHFGVNIRQLHREKSDIPIDESYRNPSHNDFSTSRWNQWKISLRDIIAQYKDYLGSDESFHQRHQDTEELLGKNLEETLVSCQQALAKMEELDNVKENANLTINKFLEVSTGGPMEEIRRAAVDLEALLGEPPLDAIYDKNRFPQRHVVAQISYVVYIWLCVLEGLYHWEPPNISEERYQQQLPWSSGDARLYLGDLVNDKILVGPNQTIVRSRLSQSLNILIENLCRQPNADETRQSRITCLRIIQQDITSPDPSCAPTSPTAE